MHSQINKYWDKISWGPFRSEIYRKNIIKFYYGIANGSYNFERTSCYCGSTNALSLSRLDKFNLPAFMVICKNCGLGYNAIRPTHKTNIEFYRNYYRFIFESMVKHNTDMHMSISGAQLERWKLESKKRYDFLFSHINKSDLTGNSVLDFGCNYGANLLEYMKNGYDVTGYDYGELNVETGKKVTGVANLNWGGFKEIIERKKKFNLVLIYHVIEHMLDLKEELTNLTKIIDKGAIVCLEVPGLTEWKKNGNFKRNIAMVHPFCFTKGVLNNILTSLGFEKIYLDDKISAIYRYTGKKCGFTVDHSNYDIAIQFVKKNNTEYTYNPSKVKALIMNFRFWQDKKAINQVLGNLNKLISV